MRAKCNGFTLSQQLIALTVVGVTVGISSIALVDYSQRISRESDIKVAEKVADDIELAWQMKSVTDGLIRKEEVPAEIIFEALGNASTSETLSSIPTGCNINLPAKNVKVLDGNWTLYAESDWDSTGPKDLMHLCVRKNDGSYITNKTLERYGLKKDAGHLVASANGLNTNFNNNRDRSSNSSDTFANAASNSNIDNSGTNIEIPVTPTPPTPPTNGTNVGNPGTPPTTPPTIVRRQIGVGARERDRAMGFRYDDARIYAGTFFDDNAAMNRYLNARVQGGYHPTLFSSDGRVIANMNGNNFWNKIFYDLPDGRKGVPFATYAAEVGKAGLDFHERINQLLLPFSNTSNRSNTLGPYLKNDDGSEDQIAFGISIFSPIKISLTGVDAKVGSENGFKLDVDGTAVDGFPVFLTSGGLNSDEAWLVLDRGNKGHFENNIMDGDDLFGDHLGKYTSGYEDLADTFKSYIHIDNNGVRYLDLTPLPWWEELWVSILRFFGFAKEFNPAIDLKLLKLDNTTINANSVISRIDLDYKNVAEFDKEASNVILQRAPVVFINGKIASSADQWFKPVRFFKAVPRDNNAKTKKQL